MVRALSWAIWPLLPDPNHEPEVGLSRSAFSISLLPLRNVILCLWTFPSPVPVGCGHSFSLTTGSPLPACPPGPGTDKSEGLSSPSPKGRKARCFCFSALLRGLPLLGPCEDLAVTQMVMCLKFGRPGFDPWVGKIPWRRERLPTLVFRPGEFRGQNSPWGRNVYMYI